MGFRGVDVSNVVAFPTEKLGKNIARHLNDAIADAHARGWTSEQIWEAFTKSLKECGLVEIDGVWRQPE